MLLVRVSAGGDNRAVARTPPRHARDVVRRGRRDGRGTPRAPSSRNLAETRREANGEEAKDEQQLRQGLTGRLAVAVTALTTTGAWRG